MQPVIEQTVIQLTPMLYGLSFVAAFVFMVFVHELGHFLAMRKHRPNCAITFRYNKGMQVYVGEEDEYKGLTHKQKIEIYFSGIGLGLFVPVFFTIAHWGFFPLFAIYFLGIKNDIELIKRNLRE